MIKRFLIIIICILFFPDSDALASRDYNLCLQKSISQANALLKKRSLASSTRFCIRQAKQNALEYLDQYDKFIGPEIKAHKSAIQACKDNEKCEGVTGKLIYFETTHWVNCNRPKVQFKHRCEMDRELKAFEKYS